MHSFEDGVVLVPDRLRDLALLRKSVRRRKDRKLRGNSRLGPSSVAPGRVGCRPRGCGLLYHSMADFSRLRSVVACKSVPGRDRRSASIKAFVAAGFRPVDTTNFALAHGTSHRASADAEDVELQFSEAAGRLSGNLLGSASLNTLLVETLCTGDCCFLV